MNESNRLEDELDQLGDKLRREPSIAPIVMAEIQKHQSAAVESPPASAPASSLPSPGRSRTRMLAGIALSLTTIASVTGLMFAFRTENVAFATVQERIAGVDTATFCCEVRVTDMDGKNSLTNRAEVMVRSDGRLRSETADGSLTVSNRVAGKRLTIHQGNKTATLAHVYDSGRERDLLALLKSLRAQDASHRLETMRIHGEACPGFRFDKPDYVLRVWVSPSSLLPVRAEYNPVNISEPSPDIHDVLARIPATDRFGKVDELLAWKRTDLTRPNVSQEKTVELARKGPVRPRLRASITFSEIRFGVPLRDKLFDLQPPSDLQVAQVGRPPEPLGKVFGPSPRLVPLLGLGPLRLGMTKEKAIQLLGWPDSEEISAPPPPPISPDTSQVDELPRPSKTSRLVMLTEYHSLRYTQLGLRLDFEIHEGLIGLMCDRIVRLGDGVEFPGKLAEGVGIGSTEKEVITAYGEPTSKTGVAQTILRYRDHGLVFQLSESRKVTKFGIEKGGEKKFRYEWRETADTQQSRR